MAALICNLGNGAQEISVNIECKNLKKNTNIMTSDLRKPRKLLSDEDLLERKSDLDELEELFTMSTRPHVRNIVLSLVTELADSLKTIECDLKDAPKSAKKWSDVVAGMSTSRVEEELTSMADMGKLEVTEVKIVSTKQVLKRNCMWSLP
jgi:hypothetical protein